MIVRITSRFGDVSSVYPKPHTGVDLGLPEGTPVQSIGEAVVERVVDYGSENIGKGVILRLADGREAIYGHLSDIKVKAGQILHEGQTIGLSGNTGHSTGPHLHFGLKENGTFIDPTPLAQKFASISVENNQSIGGFLYEKFVGNRIEDWFQLWIENYIISLPILLGVSLGVYGLLNMVNHKVATWGVGFVFIIGGIAII